MTITLKPIVRIGVAAIAAALIAGMLTACDLKTIQQVAFGQTGCHGPVAYIAADTSGSTQWARHPGGLYERDLRRAITTLARECGQVYVTTADGNAVSDALWRINGVRLTTTLNGNGTLGAAARAQDARKLWPELRRILDTTKNPYSDLLGVMQRIALAAKTVPKNTRKVMILESDMVANVPSALINLYTRTPVTPGQRQALINLLKRNGQLANLHGFNVYIGGIGLNAPRPVAQATIAFWELAIPEMGGHLISANSTLQFP